MKGFLDYQSSKQWKMQHQILLIIDLAVQHKLCLFIYREQKLLRWQHVKNQPKCKHNNRITQKPPSNNCLFRFQVEKSGSARLWCADEKLSKEIEHKDSCMIDSQTAWSLYMHRAEMQSSNKGCRISHYIVCIRSREQIKRTICLCI